MCMAMHDLGIFINITVINYRSCALLFALGHFESLRSENPRLRDRQCRINRWCKPELRHSEMFFFSGVPNNGLSSISRRFKGSRHFYYDLLLLQLEQNDHFFQIKTSYELPKILAWTRTSIYIVFQYRTQKKNESKLITLNRRLTILRVQKREKKNIS